VKKLNFVIFVPIDKPIMFGTFCEKGVSMVRCTQKGVTIWQFSLEYIFYLPF
jgi:hypothetical protein